MQPSRIRFSSKTVTVSVLIPTKNRDYTLKRCLENLCRQLQKGDEIIVIDNGSTDTTINIVKLFASKYNVIYLHEDRQGPSYARNTGFASAKGNIVAFLDDDCIVAHNWISLIKNICTRHKTIYQGKLIHKFPSKNIISSLFFIRYQIEWKYITESREWKENYYVHFINAGNFFAFKTDLASLSYLFDADTFPFIGEESELCNRLQVNGYIIQYVHEAFADHIKQQPNLFRSLRSAIYYGRAEGILETRYRVNKLISQLFADTEYLQKKSLTTSEKVFNMYRIYQKKHSHSSLYALFILLIREQLFLIGKIYGVVYEKFLTFKKDKHVLFSFQTQSVPILED